MRGQEQSIYLHLVCQSEALVQAPSRDASSPSSHLLAMLPVGRQLSSQFWQQLWGKSGEAQGVTTGDRDRARGDVDQLSTTEYSPKLCRLLGVVHGYGVSHKSRGMDGDVLPDLAQQLSLVVFDDVHSIQHRLDMFNSLLTAGPDRCELVGGMTR